MARPIRNVGWRRRGETLTRELTFRDFEAAIRFVERVADAVEDYERRPDMCITSYNHVRIVIENPNGAGLTLAEHRLADKVDAILEARPVEGDPMET